VRRLEEKPVGFGRRATWLEGRYANVDGIPFRMPVITRSSPSLFAAFSVDARAAQAMLPGQELQICRVWERALLIVAVVNYIDTTIGRYVEYCIGLMCTHGRRPAPRALPLVLQRAFGTGVYIYDLPVSSEISAKGGLGIWGMPKRQANLDFVVTDTTVSSQYDLDGQLVARIDIPRPRPIFPTAMRGAGYGSFRGLLTKSYIALKGRTGLSLRPSAASLLLGDHPRANPLKTLDIEPRPLATGFIPRLEGLLDDHIETWFLTADAPPPLAANNMRDVVDLSLSQDWLAPPDRQASDAMLRIYSPDQHVGRVPRPAFSPRSIKAHAE